MRLKVNVSHEPKADADVSVRNVIIREKLMRWMFGKPNKVVLIIPGDRVNEITISKSE